MESLMRRRAPVVLVLVVAIMFQASTQTCLGEQILPTGSGRPNDDHETSTTQEVNHNKVLKSYWIHRDHPDFSSSAANTYKTRSHSERIAAAARRSLIRAQYISRRVLHASSSKSFDSPLEYVNGDYAMAVSVGTPPQKFIAWIDTGSDLVWLNCTPCIQCIVPAADNPFDPALSSSYQEVSCTDAACTDFPDLLSTCFGKGPCDYFYGYADGATTSGVLAYETFTFTALDGSSIPVKHITFGCGQNETLYGFPGVDGIVGLAQSRFSLSSQLSSGPGFADIFSYCLIPLFDTIANHSTFYFGVPETNISIYTPIVSNTIIPAATFYYVNVTGISVGGVLLDIPADTFYINPVDGTGGIIFDDGTTFTYLTAVAYDALLKTFQSQYKFPVVSFPPFQCFDTSSATATIIVPSIVFHLQSVSGAAPVDFKLAEDNILLQLLEFLYCLTIVPDDLSIMIIGNTAQANHQMVFDRVKHQIGWASTTCT
ncbi:unnamed protein product [Sphagnum jensenii]